MKRLVTLSYALFVIVPRRVKSRWESYCSLWLRIPILTDLEGVGDEKSNKGATKANKGVADAAKYGIRRQANKMGKSIW